MKVIIYVEGPSDKNALQVLLGSLIERKQQQGVSIEFFEAAEGDRKTTLLTKIPLRAVNILRNDPQAFVVVLPDLYPRNKGFAHETVDELVSGLKRNFQSALNTKGLSANQRLGERFQVFCLKHDLEVLLLAAEEALRSRFGGRPLGISWQTPVEDQDQDTPPKFIVEAIYRQQGQRYKDTVDAPLILRSAPYPLIAERCPQCFKPFVEFLEMVGEGQ